MGADGILIPMVSSAAEARAAVSACKYPPEGTRGFGPRRASDYGRNTDAYVAPGQRLRDRDRADRACERRRRYRRHSRHARHRRRLPGADRSVRFGRRAAPVRSSHRRRRHDQGDQRGAGAPDAGQHRHHLCRQPRCSEWYAAGANFIFCGDDVTLLAVAAGKALANMRQMASGIRLGMRCAVDRDDEIQGPLSAGPADLRGRRGGEYRPHQYLHRRLLSSPPTITSPRSSSAGCSAPS